MGIKYAYEIVREGVVLVTGEYLPKEFRLTSTNIEEACLYRVLLEKAVDLVIQDYFTNFSLYLRKMVLIRQLAHYFGIDTFEVPRGLEKIISIRNPYTKALIKRIDDIEEFIESKEPCYRWTLSRESSGWEIWGRNTGKELELIYIDKAVYGGNIYLSTDYDKIYLDSNLVIFAFCKELCISQSAPAIKTEYFNNKYINRLKYLIANEKYKENSVFDLSTNSNRLVRL